WPVQDLLALVVAHELAHLLLPPGSHSTDGLVRSGWDVAELRHIRLKSLAFTPDNVAAIRKRLAQLVDVRDDLARVTSDRVDVETRLGQIDTSLPRAVPIDPQRDAYEFRAQLVNRLSGLRDRESELRAHETEVSTQLTSEERRWHDFNSRLDDLENSLPPGK